MRSIAVYSLALVGALFTWANISGRLEARRTGTNTSMIPFIGGLAGLAFCLLTPSLGWPVGVAWFVLDPGTYVAGFALYGIRSALRRTRR